MNRPVGSALWALVLATNACFALMFFFSGDISDALPHLAIACLIGSLLGEHRALTLAEREGDRLRSDNAVLRSLTPAWVADRFGEASTAIHRAAPAGTHRAELEIADAVLAIVWEAFSTPPGQLLEATAEPGVLNLRDALGLEAGSQLRGEAGR